MSSKMKSVKDKLYKKYGERCEVCGKKFKANGLTGHHIVPKSRGGAISEDNILIACYQCHFEIIHGIEYDTEEYWELINKCLRHRNKEPVSL